MATLKNTSVSQQLTLPSGTTAQRPVNPPNGSIRYNSTEKMAEIYLNRAWKPLDGAGALPRNGLQVELSYDDPNSWPGSGTNWLDTSGNSNDFRIGSNVPDSGSASMNFSTNDRTAKYKTNSTDVPNMIANGGATYVVVTRILNSSSQWRTLTRGWSNDHQVMIESGAWRMGVYDNNSAGFITNGYDQRNLWTYPDAYGAFVFRWADSDQPTFCFNHQNAAGWLYTSSFNNSNGRYNNSFSVIGGYHDGSNSVTSGSQPWGWIKYFAAYNRRFDDPEVENAITLLRYRYNI